VSFIQPKGLIPGSSEAVQHGVPLAVAHVALAPRQIARVGTVKERDFEAVGLEQVVDGDPIDAGGFHGDGVDLVLGEPRAQRAQRSEGALLAQPCCQTGTSRTPPLEAGAPGVTTPKNAVCRNQPQERAGRPACAQTRRPHQAKRGYAARRAAPATLFIPAPKITLRALVSLRVTDSLDAVTSAPALSPPLHSPQNGQLPSSPSLATLQP